MTDIENPAFLDLVAKDLIDRFGTDMAKITVIFPSIRAGLFFNNYLYKHARKPLWAPQYHSIDSIFENLSSYEKADSILLIGILYQSYTEVYNSHSNVPSNETLDEFFFFGETLLNDFDDIDKNLVNARSLFSNLKDLDQLRDDFSHLSPEQIEAISARFSYSLQGESSLKTAFGNLWNILGEVYSSFKQKLNQKGMAYPGMLTRSVIENESISFPDKQYVFVGFNVLNKCEEKLFGKLKEKALFYWDYDLYYLKTKAGKFIEKNIHNFGSALDSSHFDSFPELDQKITILSSPSESAQASVIDPWVKGLIDSTTFVEPDSAIVLGNENILPTVMHSIPSDKIENVNITMGFPITQTPVNGFLQVLTEMQILGYNKSSHTFNYRYVLPVLRHPYAKILFPQADDIEKEIAKNNLFFPSIDFLGNDLLFKHIASTKELAFYLLQITQELGIKFGEKDEGSNLYQDLYNESIFKAYQVLTRLNGLLTTEGWDIEKSTFLRLLRKLLSTVKIPFHGEPIKGLQVMGVLETRTLDFKNLLFLSVNEGFVPASNNDNSFIPEFLRKHFGLSTIDHQDSVYAYYFYRLIQRSQNVTLVYNTDKTQTGKSEISRFILQLLVDNRLKDRIERHTLHSAIQPWQGKPISIKKTPELIREIQRKYDVLVNPEASRLSPTALNTFISCSFKFYQQYIKGIKAPDDISDDLDNSVFGSIFHRAAEYLYKQIGQIPEEDKTFKAFTVQKEQLAPYLHAPNLLEKLVTRAFATEYFKGKQVAPEDFGGQQLIKYKVICHLLKRLVLFDTNRAPFTLIGLEVPITSFLRLDNGMEIKVGGIIDRLEEKDGALYIMDYKSSGTSKDYKEIPDLFIQKDKRATHVFQTFVYASALIKQNKGNSPVIPALIYMQQANDEKYSPVIQYNKQEISDFKDLNTDFEALLKSKISELFDSDTSFTQTEVINTCKYCDFKEMCKPNLKE